MNGIGSLLNFGNLVYQKKNVSTCTAVTDVTLKVLDFELLKKYMELNQAFEEKVYKGALLYCVRTHKERVINFYDKFRLKRWVNLLRGK